MNKIPCFILARKGSKGLKNKNRIKFLGKPLICQTIDYAKRSKFVSEIVVSTDDKIIANIANKEKCFVIYPRPEFLSGDTATTEKTLLHACKIYMNKFGKFDIYAYLQVTEPLRPEKILDKCIQKLIQNKKIDSCFAAYKMHKNFWVKTSKYKLISKKSEVYKPRQIKKPIYREDTGVALASRLKFLKKGQRVGRNIDIIPYDTLEGLVDIHDINDLKLGQYITKILK